MTGTAAKYDVYSDGKIDVREHLNALRDHLNGKINRSERDEVVNQYLKDGA